ncbi:MAG: glycosyltransferase family 4 protein [Chloroflexota bacterium]|nr:glycosyltransferase family 4 protein [Dehalococcoidia bacterium]MDW8047626.1 glycosyltransferase family 4 protein [Chloroflexota bacterium]
MRILMLHNRYQIRGGEDESTDLEVALLQARGQMVQLLEADNRAIPGRAAWRTGLRAVWSSRSFRTVQHRLREEHFDVLHVQNFFPLLSPAVLYAGRVAHVPVVLTLHNYRLLCPNAIFYRDDHVCEDCLGKLVPWPSVLHRCYRGSRAATGAVATMLVVHRLLRTWERTVDVFIALTEFARRKFIEGGLPADRIVVKPNFVYPDPGPGAHEGGYVLFVGRLSPEKGIQTLLAAWERLGPRMPLKVAGEGPLAGQVAEAAERNPHVEWLGVQPLERVYSLMGDAVVILVPSLWYEGFPRVIVEAYAKGTPVVASDLGAMAELVEDGRTGLRFRPGDPDDLAAKVEWAWTHRRQLAEMGQEARREFELKYTAERNYELLMEIYRLAIERARVRR